MNSGDAYRDNGSVMQEESSQVSKGDVDKMVKVRHGDVVKQRQAVLRWSTGGACAVVVR